MFILEKLGIRGQGPGTEGNRRFHLLSSRSPSNPSNLGTPKVGTLGTLRTAFGFSLARSVFACSLFQDCYRNAQCVFKLFLLLKIK